jgi:hypothetical protein
MPSIPGQLDSFPPAHSPRRFTRTRHSWYVLNQNEFLPWNHHLEGAGIAGRGNRACGAVHNPKVTRDWARHAYERKPRTVSPMTREEAEAFVRNLAERWLWFVYSSQGDVSRYRGP